MPLLTVGLLFIFVHLSCVHLATLKIHSISQTQLNLKTKDIAGSRKQGYKSHGNPVPVCISRDASMEHLLASCYQAVWGHAVRKKSGR